MNSLQDLVAETQRRRVADAQRWAELDNDRCQLCDAYGGDKRSLFIDCLWAIHEVVPEAIDTYAVAVLPEGKRGQYYLLICKGCRAALLGHLAAWRADRIMLRGVPKSHDGDLLDDEDEA